MSSLSYTISVYSRSWSRVFCGFAFAVLSLSGCHLSGGLSMEEGKVSSDNSDVVPPPQMLQLQARQEQVRQELSQLHALQLQQLHERRRYELLEQQSWRQLSALHGQQRYGLLERQWQELLRLQQVLQQQDWQQACLDWQQQRLLQQQRQLLLQQQTLLLQRQQRLGRQQRQLFQEQQEKGKRK